MVNASPLGERPGWACDRISVFLPICLATTRTVLPICEPVLTIETDYENKNNRNSWNVPA